MKSAREWKAFYAREREELGPAGLEALVRAAPDVALPEPGALVFPHTRLAVSGRLPAAVARALVRSGRDTVLALGVLHGAREEDRALVAAARAGEARARAALRRVHGPGVAGDEGRWREEFSLDGLEALLAVAARLEGRPAPRLVARYPFLVGEDPESLPGVEELRELVDSGAALVATADPIHHGAGYGTPPEARRAREDAATRAWAGERILAALDHLGRGELGAFLAACEAERSDFRDAGPVLGHLLGGPLRPRLEALALVDYAQVLVSEAPTWVAGALLELAPAA